MVQQVKPLSQNIAMVEYIQYSTSSAPVYSGKLLSPPVPGLLPFLGKNISIYADAASVFFRGNVKIGGFHFLDSPLYEYVLIMIL